MTGACRVMLAVGVAPFREAVMVALPLEEMVPAPALKLAVVELAGTLTVEGTVTAALFEETPTVVAEVRLVFERVTVQDELPLDERVVGAHCTEVRLTGAWRLMVEVAVPLRVPVTVALPLAEMFPAVALNVAVVEFAGTVTVDGTVTVPELELRPTLTPPEPAAPDRVTVQTLTFPLVSELGAHDRLLIDVVPPTTVTVPPVAVTVTGVAVGDAAMAFVIPMAEVPTAAEIVTVIVATTPFVMPPLFMPAARHV